LRAPDRSASQRSASRALAKDADGSDAYLSAPHLVLQQARVDDIVVGHQRDVCPRSFRASRALDRLDGTFDIRFRHVCGRRLRVDEHRPHAVLDRRASRLD